MEPPALMTSHMDASRRNVDMLKSPCVHKHGEGQDLEQAETCRDLGLLSMSSEQVRWPSALLDICRLTEITYLLDQSYRNECSYAMPIGQLKLVTNVVGEPVVSITPCSHAPAVT